jgi:hypothetical protein
MKSAYNDKVASASGEIAGTGKTTALVVTDIMKFLINILTKLMKVLTKSLSILAIGGICAGTALAGPGDAYIGFRAASITKANAEKKKKERRNKDRFRPVSNGTSFKSEKANN